MTALASVDSLTETLIRYKKGIEAALSYADFSHSFDDVVRGVLTGKLHFYPFTDESFAVMEVRQYPGFNAYHCFLAGGKMQHILDHQEMMLENAQKLNCDRLTLTGRRGFERHLPRMAGKLLMFI